MIIGGEGGGPWFGGVDRQLRALMLSPFSRQKLRAPIYMTRKEDLQSLKELVEAGKVTPVIDGTYPLREVPEAIHYLEEGHARGKIVITV